MAKFAWNNTKNTSTDYTPLKLNFGSFLRFFLRKTPILALNWNQQTSYQQNYKIWWPFAKRTFTTLKSFKSKLIIKVSSIGATPQVTKFGWIANTLRLNKTRNLKLNFVDCFKCYNQQASKPISLNYQRNRRFTIFFIYYCWSRISLSGSG